MEDLAQRIEVGPAIGEMGTVTRVDAGVFTVRTASGGIRARKAASCTVQPELGDAVFMATSERGAAYVLAVLERANAHGGRRRSRRATE